MLKVYMDETGIHSGSAIVAVSAYVAKPTAWRAWTKKWNVAKQPIKVFHSTDCANFRGEFQGWTKEQRDSFVAKLLPILPAHKIAGMVIAIQMDDFRSALSGHEDLAKMIGNPYTCCFQWSVMTIMEFANNYGKGERIKFIHEVSPFKGEAQKTFDYVRQFHNPKGIKITLAFGTKAENTPLQGADILAYEGGKFLKDPTETPRRAWTALDPDNTRIIAHRYGKDNMPVLISDLTNFRKDAG
ncbi:MAG: hypothetical protein ACLQOQ_14380 [Beijerinckiaceae bacterium]